MSFLAFLKQTRKLLNWNATCRATNNQTGAGADAGALYIVIGNESCDLDSAVCALTMAFLEQERRTSTKCMYLPVLNIPRRDYTLKTEVCYLFQKHGIVPEQHLTFRDELSSEILDNSRFILVDHHVSPFADRVDVVYDHRPYDAVNSNLPTDCVTHIETVGSCATLVAEQYLCNKITDHSLPLEFLYYAMLLDTVNYAADAGRAERKDFCVRDALEQYLPDVVKTDADRVKLFNELVAARSDVSSLTGEQLLRKDMKLLESVIEPTIRVALPGFPMLVQHFIQRNDAKSAVLQFASEHDTTLVLLLGMYVQQPEGTVQRDIGLININSTAKSTQLFQNILEALVNAKDPEFGLELRDGVDFMGGVFYRQTNIKATRKHILPVVKKTLDSELNLFKK